MMRRLKESYTKEQMSEKSLSVMKRLLTHPKVSTAHTVLIYASLPDEVYTIDALETMRQTGKRVLLPKVISDTELQLSVYEGSSTLRESSFHILEPTGQLYDGEEQIEVAIVPGMAFDDQGHRLGRGKGYYDRLLRRINTYKIGICFDFQMVDYVPHDENDVLMDEVIHNDVL